MNLGVGSICYNKMSNVCSYEEMFYRSVKSNFVYIHVGILLTFFLLLFNSIPILLGILYRAPNKSDFVKHINIAFTTILDTRVCHSPRRICIEIRIYSLIKSKFSATKIIEQMNKTCL